MYCQSCGASLSKEDSFCPKCGTLISEQKDEAEALLSAATLTPAPKPYDPYTSQPPTFYGSQTTKEGMQSPYAPPPPLATPAPLAPQRRRISSGFLKGLFSSILVLLLVSGGFGAFLLLKQGAFFPSAHSAKPTATAQPPAHSAGGLTTTPQPATNTIQTLPGMWTQCAVENATCSFRGTMTVAFGANGSFYYASGSNGIACTNAVFGDPLNGAQKACYTEAAPPTTNVWTHCAAENATCSFQGTMTVAFGANGSYKYLTQTNGSACTDTVFGDPAFGAAKACYLVAPPGSAATWNTCAPENNACSFTGKHEVAYGADGKYFYGSFTNGTACSNTVFGDPASGTAKTCYYQ